MPIFTADVASDGLPSVPHLTAESPNLHETWNVLLTLHANQTGGSGNTWKVRPLLTPDFANLTKELECIFDVVVTILIWVSINHHRGPGEGAEGGGGQ